MVWLKIRRKTFALISIFDSRGKYVIDGNGLIEKKKKSTIEQQVFDIFDMI